MPATAPADPERFKEASDWFRGKTAVTKDEWEVMRLEARRQSFTIAGTQQLEVVQTVMSSLETAIANGESIDKWRVKVRKSLEKRFKQVGVDFAEANASTLKTAFINANQSAYNAGRFRQMSDPAVTRALPFWMFDAVLDASTTSGCRECHGTIRPVGDPWWRTHWCPRHHKCRSTVRALSERMAKRKGGVTANPPAAPADGDFGLAPDVQPDIWEPDLSKYEQHAAREYTRKQTSMRTREREDARPRFRRKG